MAPQVLVYGHKIHTIFFLLLSGLGLVRLSEKFTYIAKDERSHVAII